MSKVTLRKKAISGNRHSLYLDFYPPISHPETGNLTRREFLGLHIFDNAKKAIDKDHNKQTLALAENVKAKRQLEIQQSNYSFLKKVKDIDFIEYFDQLTTKQSETAKDTWVCAANYLKKFAGPNVATSHVTENFCNDFRQFLLSTESSRSTSLSQNSAHAYFSRFRISLRQGFKDGIFTADLYSKIKPIKQGETHREYLTLEELQLLAKTDCSLPIMKTAALFSALTGLRFSDIEKMTWSELRYSKTEGNYLQFRQQKTKGVEVLPISKEAVKLLGKAGEPEERVFEGLIYNTYNNMYLKHWILKAGITKHITFHSFRHTFATLQISMGTDLYTVSKMLGHREIETTQIYAKVMNKQKIEAANKITLV